jgi:hypothetical protein
MEASAASLGVTLSDDLPVLARPDFKPMLPDTVSHRFSEIAEKAGLGKIGLHTLGTRTPRSCFRRGFT